MITTPTVLILGAGASADYKYPAGSDFENQICALADDDNFLHQIEEHGVTKVGEFLSRYSRSGYGSPDRFLEDYPQYITAGKYCIAKILKSCEHARHLIPPQGPTPSWYQYLVNRIYPTTGDYFECQLSVVTFNYDRSLEHYLWG